MPRGTLGVYEKQGLLVIYIRNLYIDIIKGLVLAHWKIRLLHIFFPFLVIPKKSNNKVFSLITQRQILSDFLGPLTRLNFLLGRQGGWGAQLPHLRGVL